MNPYYEIEFKKKIVRLHLEEGHMLKGLAEEYGVTVIFSCEEKEAGLRKRHTPQSI